MFVIYFAYRFNNYYLVNMAEVIIDKVLPKVVELVTGGHRRLIINEEFIKMEECEQAEDGRQGRKPHSSLIIVDMDGLRTLGRYRLERIS